ncbi:MAG: YdcF family protein [Verrucomicrobiae bacterium]|nr:YdcF family protein [Verrucomicrobiae bacterium]
MAFLGVVVALLGCNLWVVISTRERVYASVGNIPATPVGIVLGTSKHIAPDQPNPHFDNRLAAAAKLYLEGKVRHLLVSGHREEYYDEPRDMTKRLVDLGVPPTAITPDVAGHRTLDSIVRAREIYGLDRVTVISDDFHVPRALFIADRKGLDAIALRGKSVSFRDSVRARMREYLARVKAVIDLYLLDTQPANLGEPQEILVDSESTRGDSVTVSR